MLFSHSWIVHAGCLVAQLQTVTTLSLDDSFCQSFTSSDLFILQSGLFEPFLLLLTTIKLIGLVFHEAESKYMGS